MRCRAARLRRLAPVDARGGISGDEGPELPEALPLPNASSAVDALGNGCGDTLSGDQKRGQARAKTLGATCIGGEAGAGARHGGLKSDQVKRLKELEAENSRLRRAVSDLTLDKLILQEAARGNY